ncbi:MAG: RsmE family RNA methyltransferase [Planctomycetota bacterium]
MNRPATTSDTAANDSGKALPRVPVEALKGRGTGEIVSISPQHARHVVRARRLGEDDAVEVFDEAGRQATARLVRHGDAWAARLEAEPHRSTSTGVTIYAATPKGDRASWMAEKLSELGAARWVPLVTERSVVVPGANKVARFRRLAVESAKQCRRTGVMAVDEPAKLDDMLPTLTAADTAVLATESIDQPVRKLLDFAPAAVLVGPEGGWSAGELTRFAERGLAFVTLGPTILRIETAAIAAAAILQSARTEPVVDRSESATPPSTR